MAAALPLVKLGFLLVRTIAKPFAGRLKDFLKDHDSARRAFSGLGQMLHRVEVRVAGNEQYLKVDKKGKGGILQAKVKPLEEGKAVANAEVISSNQKDERKKAAMEKRFFDSEEYIRKHKIQIDSLTHELHRARQHVIALHRDAVGLMQMRPFTQDEVDAAEARLEVWISSFQDEASRRDSLLMSKPAHKPLDGSKSFFGEMLSDILGSFENAGQDPLKKPQKSNTSSVEVSSDAQLSDVEIALRKLEGNRKQSLALRKSKSKTTSEVKIDQPGSTSSSAVLLSKDGGGNAGIDVSSPPQSHAPELAAVAASSAPDSDVKWRNFALSSVVFAIVVSVVTTR